MQKNDTSRRARRILRPDSECWDHKLLEPIKNGQKWDFGIFANFDILKWNPLCLRFYKGNWFLKGKMNQKMTLLFLLEEIWGYILKAEILSFQNIPSEFF